MECLDRFVSERINRRFAAQVALKTHADWLTDHKIYLTCGLAPGEEAGGLDGANLWFERLNQGFPPSGSITLSQSLLRGRAGAALSLRP